MIGISQNEKLHFHADRKLMREIKRIREKCDAIERLVTHCSGDFIIMESVAKDVKRISNDLYKVIAILSLHISKNTKDG